MTEDNNKSPFFGGWFSSADSPLTDSSETFDVYDTNIGDYRDKEVTKFYDHYLLEYQENEWFSFLVDYVVGELFTDYQFVGEGADEVRKFFENVDPLAYDEIEMMGLNVVREGTGALKKYWSDGQLTQLKAMNGRLLRLDTMANERKVASNKPVNRLGSEAKLPSTVEGVKQTYSRSLGAKVNEVEDTQFLQVSVASDSRFLVNMRTWRINDFGDYRNEQIALCRIKRDARSPYGIPFGRSSFHVIKSLKGVNRDILASIKQNANNLKVISADLSGLDSENDKKTALENLARAYDKISSATQGVVAIDNHHEVGYMGTTGAGSRDSRVLEVMGHLEPVISALLMNYLFSIGLIEQSGANKSIISRQEIRAERQIERYRRAVARFFETQIFPDITEQPCRLVFRKYYEPEIWLQLFQTNVISREKLLEQMSIIDDGQTYFKDVSMVNVGGEGGIGRSANSKADTSNDDSSDMRRREDK
mgnify:FL=1|jgi:hypothetical protein|tara:strand:+ start:5940 stop:7370 length:1431 start_codon:yes stop_codon:yes gene_type:complete